MLVLLATLAALAGAIAFLTLREPTYEATSNVLVSPLPQEDQTFIGLDLLRDSGDATRTVQTAATLLESTAAAERTARALGEGWDADRVLKNVSVQPLGESNIVVVTGSASTAAAAAQLADEFTEAALAIRGQELQRQVEAEIERAEADLELLPAGAAEAAEQSARLSRLRSIEETGDPTLSLEQPAAIPASPTGAGPVIVIPLALLAGFALGAGGALLRELLDRRIGDAEEMLALYPLPVLARVPALAKKDARKFEEARWYIPQQVRQPFQSLVVQLEQRARPLGAIMLTSASKGDGKTTSAINLAVSLAATGKRVVLIDGDLRDPRIALALNIDDTRTPEQIAAPGTGLRELLVRPVKKWSLHVLPVAGGEYNEAAMRRLPRLIDEARATADCVVVDTPPLGEVSDALRLMQRVDDVLVVMRAGNTVRAHLRSMRELLERSGREVEGAVVLDSAERGGAGYGYGAYGYAPGGELVLGGDDDFQPLGAGAGAPGGGLREAGR